MAVFLSAARLRVLKAREELKQAEQELAAAEEAARANAATTIAQRLRRRRPNQAPALSLAELPDELQAVVVSKLRCPVAIVGLERTGKVWRAHVKEVEQLLWHGACQERWPELTKVLSSQGVADFRRLYKQQDGSCCEYRSTAPFNELLWTVEIFLAPTAYSRRDVRPVYSNTIRLDQLPSSRQVGFSPPLGTVTAMSTAEAYSTGDETRLWIRWTVRHKGTVACVYEDMPDSHSPPIAEQVAEGGFADLSSFPEGSPEPERWYEDGTHGIAHVHPRAGVLLTPGDGRFHLARAYLEFKVETPGAFNIEHSSSDEEIIAQVVFDHL